MRNHRRRSRRRKCRNLKELADTEAQAASHYYKEVMGQRPRCCLRRGVKNTGLDGRACSKMPENARLKKIVSTRRGRLKLRRNATHRGTRLNRAERARRRVRPT